MKLLNAQSQQCLRTELDLFSVPPTQTSIDSSQWVEHSPESTISASAPIEFVVAGSGDDYLDLSNTLLEVRAKLTADGSPVTAEVAVAPVNNVLQSMFSQLDVSLNVVSVSSASTTYPYRAYMETHLNYGHDAKVSKLQAGLYYMDTNLTLSDPRLTGDNAVTNTGLAKRHQLCTKTGTFDMIGPLHVDVFNQSRYLLNGVTMKLRLSRSKDAFDGKDRRRVQDGGDVCKAICEKSKDNTEPRFGKRKDARQITGQVPNHSCRVQSHSFTSGTEELHARESVSGSPAEAHSVWNRGQPRVQRRHDHESVQLSAL